MGTRKKNNNLRILNLSSLIFETFRDEYSDKDQIDK